MPQATARDVPPVPSSRFAVEFGADREVVLEQLERQVPVVLAAERDRPIGTPGRVDYTVRRGKLRLATADSEASATTSVEAEIKVCKPVGPFCVGYGSCSPRFAVRVVQPLPSGPIEQLPPPRIALTPNRGCRIAGMDVTDRLTQIARQQTGGVRARFQRELSVLPQQISQVERLIRTPLALEDGSCLRMSPREIWISKPELDARLRLFAAVNGELSRTLDCNAADPAASSAVVPKLIDAPAKPPETRILVRGSLDYDTLGSSIAAHLNQPPLEDPEDRRVRVAGVRVAPFAAQEPDRVAVTLKLAGSICGSVSFTAKPRTSRAKASLALYSIRFFDAQARAALEPFGLEARLKSELKVPVEPAPQSVRHAFDELMALAQHALSKPEALELAWTGTEPKECVATRDGLLVDVVLRARFRVSVDGSE